jgi:glycosyltransferase involved in cell wall biosynthesis
MMRILAVNDGVSDVGGVQAYLEAVLTALEARGHSCVLAYCTDSGRDADGAGLRRFRRFRLDRDRPSGALDEVRAWAPDVCFVHNMHDLSIDGALTGVAPVVKFMHGYFGTCIGGLKMHRFPRAVACERSLGPACAVLYLARGCGRVSPTVLVDELRWARRQRALFTGYGALVVASEHMRGEYVAGGVPPTAVHVNPLFPTHSVRRTPAPPPQSPVVAFLGRMTALKGGDLLLQAVRRASARLARPVTALMIGDGPERQAWEALGRRLDVPCTFTGWIGDDRRWRLVADASVVAVPSVWPEPFGLVGLEAGALGVPAVATDVGGVREWLRSEVNGVLVPAPASPDSFGDALAALLADRARQTRLRFGAAQVASEMSLARHVARLETIFHSVPRVTRIATAGGGSRIWPTSGTRTRPASPAD